MTLKYGFVKCTVAGEIRIKKTRRKKESQFHLHANLNVPTNGRNVVWDVAVNVGTNDADDLLRYRLALDFHHPIIETLTKAPDGLTDLTDADAFPALDFLRTNILAETGDWRDSDIMDGSEDKEPFRSLANVLQTAQSGVRPVYVFGRLFNDGTNGLHDIHMNQGSTGSFVHTDGNDTNDHNDVWQDGAILVDLGQGEWAGYFTAFTQQIVPTDGLGNPDPEGHEIDDDDPGELA